MKIAPHNCMFSNKFEDTLRTVNSLTYLWSFPATYTGGLFELLLHLYFSKKESKRYVS